MNSWRITVFEQIARFASWQLEVLTWNSLRLSQCLRLRQNPKSLSLEFKSWALLKQRCGWSNDGGRAFGKFIALVRGDTKLCGNFSKRSLPRNLQWAIFRLTIGSLLEASARNKIQAKREAACKSMAVNPSRIEILDSRCPRRQFNAFLMLRLPYKKLKLLWLLSKKL